MTPEKTAKYASLRDEENLTINQAEIILENLQTIRFGQPKVFVLNDACPLDVAKNNMQMDPDTPVYIWGSFDENLSSRFDFSNLVQASRNGNGFELYQAMILATKPGVVKEEMTKGFIAQMGLQNEVDKVLSSVKIREAVATK